jgi:hypothetical protein
MLTDKYDFYNNDDNDYDYEITQQKMQDMLKKEDKGYTQIWNYKKRANGSLKRAKIDVYTSGFLGSQIRNAETGEYYHKYLIGSKDEELFFKVIIATGECKSKNGSSTLFYTSPEHYMNHLNIKLSLNQINKWKENYNKRLIAVMERDKTKRTVEIVVVN